MEMYRVPTSNSNITIGGYPFFIESVTPNEPFRRREYIFNNLVGGTQDVRKGAYVGLDFSITTHVRVTPNRPDIHNAIFKKLMSKPVKISSPELGGVGNDFNAIVKIKPEHDSPNFLKLTIDIKEVPDRESHISGEKFTIPKAHAITVKKKTTKDSKSSKKSSKSSKKSKKTSVSKKSKSKKNRK